ncbi:MAG: hypothetical protein H6765_02360 [Candidatus Peribacteria bacterium]|nr:MAG: hypothetical protein H6765_02360 [Candidatus Peribacteria bacterium]
MEQLYMGNLTSLWVVLSWLFFNWTMVSLLVADLLWYELNFIVWLLSLCAAIVLLLVVDAGGTGLLLSGVLFALIFTLVYLAIYLFGRWWVKKKTGQPGEGM